MPRSRPRKAVIWAVRDPARFVQPQGAMRFRFPVLLLLFVACSDSAGPPDLLIDVQVSDDAVIVQAQEPALGCECSFGWTEVDTCRTQSDGFSCTCDPWPGSCLAEIAVVDAAGVELAATSWDPRSWAAFLSLDTDGAEAVSISGCGVAVTAPIPPPPRPAVTIDLGEDGTAAWSSSPDASSSVVTLGDGFGAVSCHRTGGAGDVDLEDAATVSVTALAAPLVGETDLGTVRVWSGNRTEVTR